MLITKVQKKHKNITSLKLRPTITRRRKLRGCEEEREGSPISIFPPLRFGIVRIFPSSVGFCSQVSALWGKRGSTGLKLRPTVTRRRKLREVVRKRGKVLCIHISTPKLWNCEIVDWLNGLLLWSLGLWVKRPPLFMSWRESFIWSLGCCSWLIFE